MSRIAEQFRRLRKQGRIVLVPFFTAGYPTVSIFMGLVREAARRGASMIEVGVPFSDPLADGPAIQYSSQQALKRHINLTRILKVLRVLSGQVTVPLMIMSYYNPIERFGLEQFCQAANKAGVAGLIVPDLPPDEGGSLEKKARQYKLDLVYLLAPNANPSRIKLVTKHTQGFVYLVSVTGVTGARKKLSSEVLTFIRRVRRFTRKPLCLGFGVSNPQQIKRLSQLGGIDGVIIGSAIIDLIGKGSGSRAVVKVGNFIAACSADCRRGMERFCKRSIKKD